jgi:hypothetical protein
MGHEEEAGNRRNSDQFFKGISNLALRNDKMSPAASKEGTADLFTPPV